MQTTTKGASLIRAARHRMRDAEATLIDLDYDRYPPAYQRAWDAYYRYQRLVGWLIGRYEVR